MKLSQRMFVAACLSLIPAIFFGSIFCFYMIDYIAHEEADEFLTYERDRLLNYYEENKSLPEFHKLSDIKEVEKAVKPYFKDTLILEEGDNELVPYREHIFSIKHEGTNYVITLRQLLLGTDDIAEGTALIILALVVLFAIVLYVTLIFISRSVWNPFYGILRVLGKYHPDNEIQFPKSNTYEFNVLIRELEELIGRVQASMVQAREFSENVTHELQTQIAVIKLQLEQLFDRKEEMIHPEELSKIYSSINSLSQMQKSLLLLSRIRNSEYSSVSSIRIDEVLRHTLNFFSENIGLRNIQTKESIETAIVSMDPGLAEVLMMNLIKNAIKHNVDGGSIEVVINEDELIITNSTSIKLEGSNVKTERFDQRSKGTGIGMDIVESVCQYYHFGFVRKISHQGDHMAKVTWASRNL